MELFPQQTAPPNAPFPSPPLGASNRSMFKAFAYRFVAENAWAKDQHGMGVAYMAQACRRMEERRDATSPGRPPLSGPLRNIYQELHSLEGEFRDLRNSYLKDNNSIYYDPVPEFDMLDPLPEAVMMMKPLPSEEEPPPTVLLSFRPTSGAEAGDKEGDKDKTDGMGEGGDKTDEEIARELHEKLNT